MGRAKIAVTLDEDTLHAVDQQVSEHRFPSRSQAIPEALDKKLLRLSHSRLTEECAKPEQVARVSEGSNEIPGA